MDESSKVAYGRTLAALHDAVASGAHDVGVRQFAVEAARLKWIEEAAWAVVGCEDDLEDAIVDLREALES